MDYDAARHLLLMHGSGTHDSRGEPVGQDDGFLCSLRPYRGLHERNFHLVMEALLVVGETMHRSPAVDRDLVLSLWEMCSLARYWGIHPDGMLQRNRLIRPADAERLGVWVDVVEGTAWGLLRGLPPHEEVERYADYVARFGWWENIDFFVPLMTRWLGDEINSDPSVVAEALGKLGARARPALPELRRALSRQYTWFIPEDQCTEEVREYVRRAIEAAP